MAVVGAVALAVSYAASVVVSGGATLAAAPAIIPAVAGLITFGVGGYLVVDKAREDIATQHHFRPHGSPLF